MSDLVRQRPDPLRARAIFVDEDFERGIGPDGRLVRTAAIALLMGLMFLTLAALLKPTLAIGLIAPPPTAPASPARHRHEPPRSRTPLHYDTFRLQRKNA